MSIFGVDVGCTDMVAVLKRSMAFVMEHQNRFSIDFMVNVRNYCFHVLNRQSFWVGGNTYSCSMCCNFFVPKNIINTWGNKVKKCLKEFCLLEEKIGANGSYEACAEMHKIKAEIFPVLRVFELMGNQMPLMELEKSGKSPCRVLIVKCRILKAEYVYPKADSLNLHQLHIANGWKKSKSVK